MKRRSFIGAAAVAASLPLTPAAQAAMPRPGPGLLTVSGDIAGGNRGPRGPLDALMGLHGIDFDHAHSFDFSGIATLPATTIEPILEYDARPHRLSGPLLTTVLKAAGVSTHDAALALRAADGYGAQTTLDEVREQRFIVATHLDGAPLALGGLGPLWAVYDPAKVPGMLDKPLNERFAKCPWALYHIEVTAV